MRRWWLLTALALTGCVNGLAQRQAELNQWVGKPEAALLAAMGAPNRAYETNGMKFLTFEERSMDIIPGGPFFGPGPFGFDGGFPPETVTYVCDTTFTIVDGTVRAYSLRGNGCG
ncbi:MAG TPA: hypothetical protein VHO91_23225 [Rhodopila sp.]|nr:hypothetical protein [Rhodopila sp.]